MKRALIYLSLSVALLLGGGAMAQTGKDGPMAKLDHSLIELHQRYAAHLASRSRAPFSADDPLIRLAGDYVIVDAVADGDAEALVEDYARCAAWAVESGADVVEAHLALPDPFAGQPQLIFENIPLAAQILYGVRTTVGTPVLAKLGVFRSPRALHDTATKLASWTNGFTLIHAFHRPVVDDKGEPAFEGPGRERADVVGADTFAIASRQVTEMLVWRKAGAWDRAILAAGGVSSVERAAFLLHEGADAVLVATTALVDPLFAARFRQALAAAVA